MEADVEKVEKTIPLPVNPLSQVSVYWKSIKLGLSPFQTVKMTESQCTSVLFYIATKRNLFTSEDFSETLIPLKKLFQILEKLENVCMPFIFLLYERLKFFNRRREDSESEEEYLKALYNMSKSCDFDERDAAVKEQFVKEGNLCTSLLKVCDETQSLDLLGILQKWRVSEVENSESYFNEARDHHCRKSLRVKVERLKIPMIPLTNHFCQLPTQKDFTHPDNVTSRTASDEFQGKRKCLKSGKSITSLHSNFVVQRKNRISHVNSFGNFLQTTENSIDVLGKSGDADGKGKADDTQKNSINCSRVTLLVKNKTKNSRSAYRAKCRFCGEKFLSYSKKYKTHIKSHICTCDLCGDLNICGDLLSWHLRQHLGADDKQSRHIKKDPNQVTVKRASKKFHCEECNLSFPCCTLYTKHLKSHKNKYRCELCDKNLLCHSAYRTHMNAHAGVRPHQCQQCPLHFTRKGDLNLHMKVHDPERRKDQICDVCGSAFYRIYELNRHMKLHTGKNAHICPTCGKAFTDKTTCERHVRTHTGVKPYTCEKCGKSFAQRAGLNGHIDRHHNKQNQYVCPICGVSFAKKFYLGPHIKSHSVSNPLKCEQCSACFANKSALNRHQFIHTGGKTYTCNMCGKTFPWARSLKRHIDTHDTNRLKFLRPWERAELKLVQANGNVRHTNSEAVQRPPSITDQTEITSQALQQGNNIFSEEMMLNNVYIKKEPNAGLFMETDNLNHSEVLLQSPSASV